MVAAYPLYFLGLLVLFSDGGLDELVWALGICAGGVVLIMIASGLYLFGSYLRSVLHLPPRNQGVWLVLFVLRDVLVAVGPITAGVGLLSTLMNTDVWVRSLMAVVFGVGLMFILRYVTRRLRALEGRGPTRSRRRRRQTS